MMYRRGERGDFHPAEGVTDGRLAGALFDRRPAEDGMDLPLAADAALHPAGGVAGRDAKAL